MRMGAITEWSMYEQSERTERNCNACQAAYLGVFGADAHHRDARHHLGGAVSYGVRGLVRIGSSTGPFSWEQSLRARWHGIDIRIGIVAWHVFDLIPWFAN